MTCIESRRGAILRCGQVIAIAALAAILGANATQAAEIVFTINSALSSETWSGHDSTLGTLTAQSAGSLTSSVAGHFVVSFDPTSGLPGAIQVLGTGNGRPDDGYVQLNPTAHSVLPGAGFSLTAPAAANAGGQFSIAGVKIAIRDVAWDFSSPSISATSAGAFNASSTTFFAKSGGIDVGSTTIGSFPLSFAGVTDSSTQAVTGSWMLSESSSDPASWTLTQNVTYTNTYNSGPTVGTLTATGVIVANAQFGSSNLATVPTSGGLVDVLGGPTTAGGVSVSVAGGGSGGTFSAQQLPNISSLPAAAQAAGAGNSVFGLSTDPLVASPQIWNLEYTGTLNGLATVVLHYDPSTPTASLVVWHFVTATGLWENLGGTVDPVNDTITFQTSSFSPFELGVAVPEPSTWVLAGCGLATLIGCAWRRRLATRSGP